jgi:hypothetical protein
MLVSSRRISPRSVVGTARPMAPCGGSGDDGATRRSISGRSSVTTAPSQITDRAMTVAVSMRAAPMQAHGSIRHSG